MNPAFLPSLQHMASVTITAHIYCMSEFPSTAHTRDERITDVKKKILSAELPKSLKKRFVDFIYPIHRQIEFWINDHACSRFFNSSYLTYISWKSEGTIDKLQTAKNMLRNKDFPLFLRFLMACTYFLEDDILNIWTEMKREGLDVYYKNTVVLFWLKWLNRRDKIHWSQMFCEHFTTPEIQKSNPFIRVTRILDFLPQESRLGYLTETDLLGHEDDIRLCLYQLDEQQRIQLMKSNPSRILVVYLRWPFQTLFMKMADQLWAYMTIDDYYETLMVFLLYYVFKRLEYFDYLGLFREFWHSSPSFFKEDLRKREVFVVVEAILDYDKDSCTLSVEDAKKYYLYVSEMYFI